MTKSEIVKSHGRLGWWFAMSDTLPHGDGRKIVIGKTHTVKGKIVPCQKGLHASGHVLDALEFAYGATLYRVRLAGIIVKHGRPVDKMAASARTYLAKIDATAILRQFARECALDVAPLWGAPAVVLEYLKVGDEALRRAAEIAVKTPRWNTESAVASAARSAAAWSTTWSADWNVPNAAANVAWSAARSAGSTALKAARSAQKKKLDRLCLAALKLDLIDQICREERKP